MLGFLYLKTSPTTYVMLFREGKLVKEGLGLSFYYFAPWSVVVTIPQASQDVPFIFNEVSSDFQEVSIQGQLTFRIANPGVLSKVLDFSLDSRQRYLTEDSQKLNERLVRASQVLARAHIQRRPIKELLVGSADIVKEVLGGLRESSGITSLGVEILDFTVTSVTATPELSRAMQADTREALLRRADEAIAERRNAAVEQERKIKENELLTEMVVEQKRKQVRETTMDADISVEKMRVALVEQRAANEAKEAEGKAASLRGVLQPFKEVDWRTLMAIGHGQNAESLIAMAFRDLADNAGKIENLNITPDLLSTLLGASRAEAEKKPRGK